MCFSLCASPCANAIIDGLVLLANEECLCVIRVCSVQVCITGCEHSVELHSTKKKHHPLELAKLFPVLYAVLLSKSGWVRTFVYITTPSRGPGFFFFDCFMGSWLGVF